ncbi:hypothetical protein BV25DRAFT_1837583 [Artomyces pyxidatus]|uniref:Uncharacterized protein n=1 Tax=Artomyces pyxidatus TaxID=48021 RepID=A0ACB8T540_9AGAM|nr:hypothetical protein BV25DRAFT_1837583 [Artomyces pyxidatus]
MSDPDTTLAEVEMPVKSVAIRDAAAPFDDTARADIILRSSDGVDFRVYKNILSLASPVFGTMFSLPQPAEPYDGGDEVRHGLPVLPLTEDAHTLNIVLRWCYPVAVPRLTSLSVIRCVFQAAHKYAMDDLCDSVELDLLGAMDADPLGVFAVATSFGLETSAAQAATRTLQLPLAALHSPELHRISSGQYYALLAYRLTCGVAARDVALSKSWFNLDLYSDIVTLGGDMDLCKRCCVEDGQTDWYAPRFVWSYLRHAGTLLLHHPYGEAVKSAEVAPSRRERRCEQCRVNRFRDFHLFMEHFAREVDSAVAQVSVPRFY